MELKNLSILGLVLFTFVTNVSAEEKKVAPEKKALDIEITESEHSLLLAYMKAVNSNETPQKQTESLGQIFSIAEPVSRLNVAEALLMEIDTIKRLRAAFDSIDPADFASDYGDETILEDGFTKSQIEKADAERGAALNSLEEARRKSAAYLLSFRTDLQKAQTNPKLAQAINSLSKEGLKMRLTNAKKPHSVESATSNEILPE